MKIIIFKRKYSQNYLKIRIFIYLFIFKIKTLFLFGFWANDDCHVLLKHMLILIIFLVSSLNLKFIPNSFCLRTFSLLIG